MIEEKYKIALEKIKNAKNILLVTHNNPDGDAISSICAMVDVIESLNKNYTAFCKDLPPYQLLYLPHSEVITNDIENLNFDKFDLIIALDCGSLNRTSLTEEINNKRNDQYIIEFDHHPKIVDYTNLEIRLTSSSSTAEIVYNFIHHNNLPITKNIANCILTGILTDTGNFLYPNTSEKAIKIASDMLIHGAKYQLIMENTWRNKSLAAMKIWGKAMGRLKINKKYNLAFSIITHEDLKSSDVTDEELEGIAGFLCNIHDLKGLIFLRSVGNGIIKGSLRSNHPDMDISKLAKILGGGGHPKASGFVINGKLTRDGDKWEIR